MTLEDLLKLAQKPRRVLPIGTLPGCVRGWNAGEIEEARSIATKLEMDNSRRVMIAMALCEENGTPLCGEPEKYVEKFAGLPEGVVSDIMAKLEEASRLLPGEAEELMGNSKGRTDGSSAVSP
jgi:hypothetical protein